MARMTLGQRFKRLRADKSTAEGRKIYVVEAAEAIGISREFLSGIENDHDKPGHDTMVAAANYYGVSTDWLSTEEGDPRPTVLQERTARLVSGFEALDDFHKGAVERLVESLVRR
jgi:transcriptional regulator with XRE-family HTH domain